MKAKQDAAAFAASEKQKKQEAFSAFFRNIEAGLGIEINKANPELLKHELLTGHKAAGLSMDPKRFETQIRVSYGRAATCEVNLDQAREVVLVEMIGEPDANGAAVPQSLIFGLTHSESGTIAHELNDDGEASGEFGGGEIAQCVITGIIRGHFE